MQNRGNRRSSHSTTEWQHNHPAASTTCTHTEKESVLHRHASWRRVQNDSKGVDLDDQSRKPSNRKRAQVQNLYPLMAINPEGAVNVAEKTDPNLRHDRLGHMLQVRLDRLMVVGYTPKLQAKTDFCEHCRYKKQTRSPHSLKYEMVQQPLEPVHTNICGSMPKRSRGGSWYFITFVDDCTTKVWAYSIKSKDEALEIFSRWLAKLENRSGQWVKTLWSDKRGEYTSWSFKQYLSDKVIYPHAKRHDGTNQCDDPRESDGNATTIRTKARILGRSISDNIIFD